MCDIPVICEIQFKWLVLTVLSAVILPPIPWSLQWLTPLVLCAHLCRITHSPTHGSCKQTRWRRWVRRNSSEWKYLFLFSFLCVKFVIFSVHRPILVLLCVWKLTVSNDGVKVCIISLVPSCRPLITSMKDT